MLRAMGYAAVKVCYCSKKILKPGGRGVEAKVAKAMRERFGSFSIGALILRLEKG